TMECFTSGTKTVKVVPEDSCCKTEAAPVAMVYAKCCDVEKSEVTFHSYKVEPTDFVLLPLLSTFVTFAELPELFVFSKKWISTPFAHAPPLSSRDILIQICQYSL